MKISFSLSDSGHQAFIHMSLLPTTSTNESINSVQLTNFYSTSSSVRISTTQRSMDHNNNHHHSITTPIIREMQTDEKSTDSTIIKNSIKIYYLLIFIFICSFSSS